MFGWLSNAFKSLLGFGASASAASVQAALNTIATIFSTTYKYWHTVSGHVANGWQELTRTLLYLRQNMQQFTFAQYLFDVLIIKRDIPWLANWIAWLGGKVRNDLAALERREDHRIAAGDAAQHAYTRSIFLWILIHVLGFLYGLLKSVFGWINGIGAKMWHYFTHLAEFAELLFMFLVASLEKHAWEIGKLLGQFFLSLIIHNMVRFAHLMEAILDAVI
jgi:hypothetical protein